MTCIDWGLGFSGKWIFIELVFGAMRVLTDGYE
jgi:hypothetical protein